MSGASLEGHYALIEQIVRKVMSAHEYHNPVFEAEARSYTEDEIVAEYKGLILAMQGSWTSQHTYSWKVCNARYEEDAPAAVHMWRPNDDGTRRLMMRDEVLTNKTMFPIGRIALDLEHLRMFEMLQVLKKLPKPPSIHGCINDCFMLSGISSEEAKECCSTLSYPDGTPVFKLKEGPRLAPLCEWKYKCCHPRMSRWRANGEHLSLDSSHITKDAFWLRNKDSRSYRYLEEPEGLGRFPDGSVDDAFQEEVAEAGVENEGILILGAGGTGKSEIIKRLTTKFEAKGYWDPPSKKFPKGRSRVILCGFTHVAAANLDDGITVFRTLHRDARRKRTVFVFDEASMISLSMWGLIAQLKFTGNIIVVLGDFDGQFGPIFEESPDDLPFSRFMLDLVNNLVVRMRKYRRGDDYEHFKFTTSIYPRKLAERNESLQNALTAARRRYPTRGVDCVGTNLVVTHRTRVQVNEEVNSWLAPTDSVLVKASEYANLRDANKPQDMRIWEGIVLMARVKGMLKIKTAGGDYQLQNGRRYQVMAIAITEDSSTEFEMACVNDKDEKVSETIMMSEEDLARTMRLTHAFTYYSSQARTITGELRLCDTDHRHFSLRHLIVGLGRAPRGDVVQVE